MKYIYYFGALGMIAVGSLLRYFLEGEHNAQLLATGLAICLMLHCVVETIERSKN